ncbi:MAG: methylmalonyl-CoA mutase family protein [Hyphomicrobiales bacterium]|nr:methylmalonyl-CoA mutase family protein [Hyphomicrobiales bacterium]MCA1998316.1 methylmalonyl-CoA mutase family protein [Hyphomicrobiales bacterium]
MRLAGDFPRATEAQWHAAVEAVLKGRDFTRALIGRTRDGIPIEPLLPRRADAEPIHGARGAGRWRIAARLDDPDPERGNRQILDDLLGGADMVTLTFAGAPAARGFGLPDHAPITLERALHDVHCDLIALRLESTPFGGRASAEAIAGLARRRRLPGGTVTVDFGLQPLADWAAAGRMPLTFAQAMANIRSIIGELETEGFTGPFLRCDGRPFHEAGAGEAQELAALITQGLAYLRALEAQGIAPETTRHWLSFTLAVDADQFLGIAKIRALRLLWARVEAVLGLETRPIAIHAETAWRMLSRDDRHTNLLRNTIATLAAGLGGADSVAVLPFTAACGLPDGFARRLARNTGLIAMDESQLHRFADPAAGAGAIEALTDRLCEAAWTLLRQIEAQHAQGETGLPAALANGFLATLVRETRQAREVDLATRREPITGISEFPDLGEAAASVLAPLPHAGREGGWATSQESFPSRRLAEPFEQLRDRAGRLAAAGRKPAIFLANLGRIADFNSRATFARSAFEAGGIAALGNDGFAIAAGTDLAALAAAFREAGTPLACLCGTDSGYAAEAEEAARALKAAGAACLWLAGKPGESEMAWRAAGIDRFLFASCDILALLGDALDRWEETR